MGLVRGAAVGFAVALLAGCGVGGEAVRTPVVVVGVAGLTWDVVSEERTPNLWRMLEGGADAAAVTVRTVHSPPCPLDGWLSLSAGRAATDPAPGGGTRTCSSAPTVVGNRVDGWERLVAGQSASLFDPDLGLLGQTLTDARICATAVGPGAALTLADSRGNVARYHAQLNDGVWGCPITVIDGSRAPDEIIGSVLRQMPSDATLVVLGLGNSELAMGTMAVSGPRTDDRFLTAQTTRWQGIVRLLDVPSTLVAAVGLSEPNHFSGSPIVASGTRPETAKTAAKLTAVTTRDRDLRDSSGPFINGLAAAAVVLFAILALSRRRTKPLEMVLLATATLPLCSYLVRLVQWWRWPVPLLVLWTGMLLGSLACALALRRVPRLTVWSTATIVSAVTVVVLAVDAMTGTILHHGSPLGPSPLSGGRYYGFGNTTFVVFAVHGIILAAGLASWMANRAAAASVVAAVGAVIIVIDVWPSFGADLGGGFALVPAFVLLAMNVRGWRISLIPMLATGLAAVAAVALISYLDWLRPAGSRSHAGRFVEDLVNGDGFAVITRKAGYAVHSLAGGPHLWLTAVLLVYLIAVVVAPARLRPRFFDRAIERWPRFWGVFVGIVTIAAVGSAANDYGLRVALIAVGVAGPPLMLIWFTGEREALSHPTVAIRQGSDQPWWRRRTMRHKLLIGLCIYLTISFLIGGAATCRAICGVVPLPSGERPR